MEEVNLQEEQLKKNLKKVNWHSKRKKNTFLQLCEESVKRYGSQMSEDVVKGD